MHVRAHCTRTATRSIRSLCSTPSIVCTTARVVPSVCSIDSILCMRVWFAPIVADETDLGILRRDGCPGRVSIQRQNPHYKLHIWQNLSLFFQRTSELTTRRNMTKLHVSAANKLRKDLCLTCPDAHFKNTRPLLANVPARQAAASCPQ
jgi:hypothetical protein